MEDYEKDTSCGINIEKDSPGKTEYPFKKAYYENQFGSKSVGEPDWKPHVRNAFALSDGQTYIPSRTDGPDWSSRVRCPLPITAKELEPISPRRTGRVHFPHRIGSSFEEWTFYEEGYYYGKRCYIEGRRMGNKESFDETTLDSVLGKCLKVHNRRGSIPEASPGDKSYAVPEYSKSFHKVGSTLPAVNFSRSSKFVSDTFIPLQPLPKIPKMTYITKEKRRLKEEEKKEVVHLNSWKQAPVLVATL